MKLTKISVRIIATVLPVVFLSTISLVLIVYLASDSRIRAETEQRLFVLLDAEMARIKDELDKNAAIAQGIVSYVSSVPKKAFLSGDYSRFLFHLVPSNANTVGGGIWFEPYVLDENIRYFGPYVHRKEGGHILTHMYSNEEYDYPFTDWYLNGKASTARIAWTDVYHDPLSGITMLTGAQPFFNQEGVFMGVASADMDVVAIRQMVKNIRVGETGRAFLLDSKGGYIVFVDEDKPLALKMADDPDRDRAALGRRLTALNAGVTSTVMNGAKYSVYYRTVPDVDWTLGIVIKDAEILAPVRSLISTMLGVTVATLVLMTLAVMTLAERLHSIIDQINAFSRIAAEGRLEERLHLEVRDEFRSIADNLNAMMSNMERLSASKSDFLSRMSHEIRTPMNAILGMVQIGRSANDTEKLKHCLAKIESNSNHLLGIINDILDFSKVEAGKLLLDEHPISLTENMQFVVSMFTPRVEEKQLTLELDMRGIEHDQIITDPLRLNQVLINLLSNAGKFTPRGGNIRITVLEQSYRDGWGIYSFSVADNGIGIAPEKMERLFNAFEQASASTGTMFGGTGLGLPIAKSVVEKMGGTITVQSEPGRGSTFSFTIRVAASSERVPAEEKPETPAGPPDMRGKRVLIVDDIDINREIVIELLRDTGAVMDVAENGAAAVETFLAAPSGHYHLILMDMQMPVMDGCAATRAIRAAEREDAATVPIVAMTANVLQDAVREAFAAGMNGHIAKPVVIEELYAMLRETG